MDKKFNIHDWQAKQRLAEQDDDPNWQKRQDALTPGKNPDAFYGPGSPYQKLKQKSGNKSQESMSNADIGALQKVVGEYSLNKILNTIAVIADRTGKYDEADMIKNLASKIDDHEDLRLEPEDDEYEDGTEFEDDDLRLEPELDEHHAGDYNPGFLKQSVNTFLDKLKKKTKEGKDYKTVKKIMEKHFSAKKEVDEASMTGTGASFQAGSGEGYATPYAFKKKRKKD